MVAPEPPRRPLVQDLELSPEPIDGGVRLRVLLPLPLVPLIIEELDVRKIPGAGNMADVLTNNLPRPLMTKQLAAMNIFPEDGRADAAPAI